MGRTPEQNDDVIVEDAQDHESFIEKMERAARGEWGAFPADDPEQSGEDRFDAG